MIISFMSPDNIISTHILTRRMTYTFYPYEHLEFYFNSHPHEEDDNVWVYFFVVIVISTHILTRRMTVLEKAFHSPLYFNSHPHEEDDNIFFKLTTDVDISTHILTRRMTSSSSS